jgi:F-type H+-transporting ATPase subunit b
LGSQDREKHAVDINWTTFLLEIINFLVLVWLLKHFLFRPVQDMILQRKAGIDKSLADAAETLVKGEKLKTAYEGRLADWEKEKQEARKTFNRQLEEEYAGKLDALQASLQAEREKAQAAEEHRLEEIRQSLEEAALQQGARFAATLLAETVSRETEDRLLGLFLAQLDKLPEERIAELGAGCADNTEEITVTSAFDFPAESRKRLEASLAALCGREISLHYERDGGLVAGIQVVINHTVLSCNLRDELRDFARSGLRR